VVLVTTAVATPFHGAQLGEFLLPIMQYVRFNTAQARYFTNSEIAFGGNGGKKFSIKTIKFCGINVYPSRLPEVKPARKIT